MPPVKNPLQGLGPDQDTGDVSVELTLHTRDIMLPGSDPGVESRETSELDVSDLSLVSNPSLVLPSRSEIIDRSDPGTLAEPPDLLPAARRPARVQPVGEDTLVTSAANLAEAFDLPDAHEGTARLPLPGLTAPHRARERQSRAPAAQLTQPVSLPAPRQPASDNRAAARSPISHEATAEVRTPAAAPQAQRDPETARVSLRRLMPGQYANHGVDSSSGLSIRPLRGRADITETAAIAAVHRSARTLRRVALLVVAAVLCASATAAVLYLRRDLRLRSLETAATAALTEVRQRGDATAYARAREHLRAWVDADPTNVAAQAALARTLAALRYEFGGHPALPALTEEAQAAVYLVQSETSADARTAQVYQALLRGDAVTAAREATALREQHGELGLGDYLLGLSAVLRGDAEEAAARLQAAVSAMPPNAAQPLRQLWLARALRDRGQDEAARAVLRGLLRQSPDHPGARVELAGLLGQGAVVPGAAAVERESAVRDLQALVHDVTAGNGERAQALLELAALALQPPSPSLTAARARLREARAQLPGDDVRRQARLAQLWLSAHDPDAAMAASREALQRAAYRDDIRLLLVRALLQRGRAAEALAELDGLASWGDAALETSKPLRREQRLLRGATLLALDQTVPAQELLQALLNEDSRGPLATEARLLLLRSLREDDAALAQRLLAQLREPGAADSDASREAQLQEVRLWLQHRPPRRDAALRALSTLVDQAPYLLEARLQLGRLLRALGRPRDAVMQLREAVALDEDSAPARRELAAAAEQSGDLTLAQAQLDALLRRDDDAELLLQAARVHRLRGDSAGALQLLTRARPGREVPAAALKAERDAALRAQRASK